MAEYGKIVQWAVIGGIAYFVIKAVSDFKFPDFILDVERGLGAGYTVEENKAMAITPETTEQVWEKENQNIAVLIPALKTHNLTQITNAGNITELNTLKAQYEANINDFEVWKTEAIVKSLEAQTFLNMNRINPIFWLNPQAQASILNAETQIIDSENNINYYNQQLELNKKNLSEVLFKIKELSVVTSLVSQPIEPSIIPQIQPITPVLGLIPIAEQMVSTPSQDYMPGDLVEYRMGPYEARIGTINTILPNGNFVIDQREVQRGDVLSKGPYGPGQPLVRMW